MFFAIVFPLAATEPEQTIQLIPTTKTIQRSSGETFGFQTLPANGKTVLLEITSRSDYSYHMGSTAIMKIFVNGHEVLPAKFRGAVRLANKPQECFITPNQRGPWFADSNAWRVVYAPDFEAAHSNPKLYDGNPYTLLLDISDLLNPVAENRIRIVNLIDDSPRWQFNKKPYGSLVLKELNLKIKDGESPMIAPAVKIEKYINRGEPAAKAFRYRAALLPGGALELDTGEEKIVFNSRFSYPDAGFNYLQASLDSGNKSHSRWKPIVKNHENGGELLASCPDYKLRRTIHCFADKIEISDTFTNLRNRNLAILHSNGFSVKGLESPIVRLAGNTDPSIERYYATGNSSIHLTFNRKSLGMLGEDDLSMVQTVLLAGSESAELRNEFFKLNPLETYTLKWAVYPINGTDYFDFINAVRKNWNINYTLDGPYTLFNPEDILAMPPAVLRESLKRHGIKYIISNGEWRMGEGETRRNGFGLGVFDDIWEPHRRKLRMAAEKIKNAVPDIKILVYYDAMRDSSPNSNVTFHDSARIDEKGWHHSTTWGGSRDNICYSYVPTMQNSFGKAMLDAFDRYLEVTGSDGIYVDEMNCGGAFNSAAYTVNQFDGHSCLIDPERYVVRQEIGLNVLLNEDWQLALIAKARKSCGYLLGNGSARTHKLLDAKVGRMIETQFNDFWCYQGMLSSPLGWTYPARSTFDGTIRTIGLGCLPVGVPLSSTHEISRFLFPFTPIELHSGYLLGQEKIIILHDGNYGWHGEHALGILHRFDKDGKHFNDPDTVTSVNAKGAKTRVKLNQGEAMIIERLPIRFNSENAEVKNLVYDTDKISLWLDAPAGGILTLESGNFKIEKGTEVCLNGQIQERKDSEKGVEIKIPLNFSGEVLIKTP
jgi:hypothetical protein